MLLGVIIDGALFFFLLMGWHTLCDAPSKTDCEPRNFVYNMSIQVLNIFFSYMAVISMPWRSSNFLHLTQWSRPQRPNHVGLNLYGMPDPELWFYIPVRRRLGITVILLLNCIFQFVNQGTRFYYHDFEQQDTHPGNIWTTVFFVASFVCAGLGGAWMAYEAGRLRKQRPGQFGPGSMDTVKRLWQRYVRRKKEVVQEPQHEDEEDNLGTNNDDDDDHNEIDDDDDDDEEHQHHHHPPIPTTEDAAHPHPHHPYVDPTRAPGMPHVLRENLRAALRMWGM